MSHVSSMNQTSLQGLHTFLITPCGVTMLDPLTRTTQLCYNQHKETQINNCPSSRGITVTIRSAMQLARLRRGQCLHQPSVHKVGRVLVQILMTVLSCIGIPSNTQTITSAVRLGQDFRKHSTWLALTVQTDFFSSSSAFPLPLSTLASQQK